MAITADAVVIGGGIAGASAAWGLSQQGLSVVLVEQEAQLAHHTTGRSAAIFLESLGPTLVQQLTKASRVDFESAPEQLGTPEIFTPRGAMWLATDLQLAELDVLIAATPSLRRIAGDEALARAPQLRPETTAAAAIEDHAAEMDVLAMHAGFLRAAREHDATVERVWKVVAIDRLGAGWNVRSEQGRDAQAAHVVVAAGAWCDHVASLAGAAPLGLRPLRRTIAICPTRQVLDPFGPHIHHVDSRYYWKPEGPNVLCSPADETPSDPCDARPDEADVALAIERVNATTTLDLRSVRTAWAGLRTFSPDRVPVCGEALDTPGLWWMAGQGGYGIQTAPAMGRAIGALVSGNAWPAVLAEHGLSPRVLGPSRLT